MNQNEVLKVMAILEVSYPNWVSKLDVEKKQVMVSLWSELFAEDNGNLIANAVKAIIISDTNPFPPTIAAIKQKAYDLSHKQSLSEMEAWNIVMLALRNCGRNSIAEYAKLPREVQVITTPQQLREWSQMDIDQLNTVVSSNFMRSYRSRSQYVKQNELLPESMKVLLSEMKEQFKLENK